MAYNNDNMNKKLYARLSEFNDKYHLYSKCLKTNAKKGNCKRGDLEGAYENVKQDMNDMLTILNNNKTMSRNKDITISDQILDNIKLRMKLEKDLEKLHISNDLNLSKERDFAVESGLLWITLTTVCVFFILVKL
jgi:hypothetical protein